MLVWLLLPVTIYLSLSGAYLLAVVLGSWCYRPPGRDANRASRIAVIIPAHNEGRGILATLRDLAANDYPAAHRSVLVIADNCSDDTAAIAREAGATVFERTNPVERGKGQALNWLLRSERELLAGHDLIVIIDADMYVDRQFLAAIDRVFSVPSVSVVQGRYTIANAAESWLTAFGFLGFAYVNHVRAAGRCFLGGSCGLKGSGMAFRSKLLLETGWPAGSVAEDVEFGRMLAKDGIRVHYDPRAIVTSDIPGDLARVRVQQERWESGKHSTAAQQFPQLLRLFLRRPSRMLADELLDMLLPPFTLHAALIVVAAAIALFSGAIPWIVVLAGAVALGAALLTGMIQLRMPARALRFLLMSPLFIAFKLLLLARLALRPRSAGWNRTPRSPGSGPESGK